MLISASRDNLALGLDNSNSYLITKIKKLMNPVSSNGTLNVRNLAIGNGGVKIKQAKLLRV